MSGHGGMAVLQMESFWWYSNRDESNRALYQRDGQYWNVFSSLYYSKRCKSNTNSIPVQLHPTILAPKSSSGEPS